MVPAAAVFGKRHDLFGMGVAFSNLTSLTLDMRRRTLMLSDVFLTMTQLRSIDIAFSFVADGFDGYSYHMDVCEEMGRARTPVQQLFADAGSCYRFLERLTLRYLPCSGVSNGILSDSDEVPPMASYLASETYEYTQYETLLTFFFLMSRGVKELRLYQEGSLEDSSVWPMFLIQEHMEKSKGLEVLVVENALSAGQGSDGTLREFILHHENTLREVELVFNKDCDWEQIQEDLFGYCDAEGDDEGDDAEMEMPEGKQPHLNLLGDNRRARKVGWSCSRVSECSHVFFMHFGLFFPWVGGQTMRRVQTRC